MSLRAVSLWSAIREAVAAGRPCAPCRHFCDDPARIERELPGLATLSSAHAAVRGGDGLCMRHDRVVNGQRRCAGFAEPDAIAVFGPNGNPGVVKCSDPLAAPSLRA